MELMSDADFFPDLDGNLLPLESREYRIYGDDMAQTWVVVDQEDYQWAIKWRWHFNKPHPRRNGSKQYLCRSNGGAWGRRPRIYLHIEIMKRKGVPPPDKHHSLVAHLDDDEMNCRRENLEWTTPKKNRSTSAKANSQWKKLNERQRKSREVVQAG